MERAHPQSLRVIHTLTRETTLSSEARAGRVSTALLQRCIPDPSGCRAYVCGPGITPFDSAAAKQTGATPEPRFLETAVASLREAGVPRGQIKHESYG